MGFNEKLWADTGRNKERQSSVSMGVFLKKLENAENVKITGLGDSIMAGGTTTTPSTDAYLVLLKNFIESKYGVTCTVNNRATSGYTVAHSFFKGKFDLAFADMSDLYIISFGHNDIKSDNVTPGQGYPKDRSITGIEHMIRKIKVSNPNANIMLIAESPYGYGIEPVVELIAYSKELQKLACLYGCMFVDCYTPFINIGDYSAYMYDGGHPNTLGHKLMFDTISESFVSMEGITPSVMTLQDYKVRNKGSWRYDPRNWDVITKDSAVGTNRWLLSGTWSGAPFKTTTVGSLMTCIARCSEMMVECILDAGTELRISLNGDAVYNNLVMSEYSANQTIYIPIIPANQTDEVLSLEFYLRAGGLTINNVYALISPNNYIAHDNPNVIYTGAFTGPTANATSVYNSTYRVPDTVATYSIELDFIGTGIAMDFMGSAVVLKYAPTIDGVVLPTQTMSSPTAYVAKPRCQTIVSGLEYGLHKMILTPDASNTKQPRIGGFVVFDETRQVNPRLQRGVCKVGETVTYPVPLDEVPFVKTFGNTLYSTTETKTNFVVSGTSGQVGKYEVDGNIVSY